MASSLALLAGLGVRRRAARPLGRRVRRPCRSGPGLAEIYREETSVAQDLPEGGRRGGIGPVTRRQEGPGGPSPPPPERCSAAGAPFPAASRPWRIGAKWARTSLNGVEGETERAALRLVAAHRRPTRCTGLPWVRHEALHDRGRVKGPPLRDCRSQPAEAGGSLNLEAQVRAGSSPDNDGTGRHLQTARARQARRDGTRLQKPVVEPPQGQNRLAPGGHGPARSARPATAGRLRNPLHGARRP